MILDPYSQQKGGNLKVKRTVWYIFYYLKKLKLKNVKEAHAHKNCHHVVFCAYVLWAHAVHGVSKYLQWFLRCFIWLFNINHRIKAVLNARVVKNRMLRNYGIDPHRRLSGLLTRPLTCYKAQYVCNLVSSLYQSRSLKDNHGKSFIK